MPLGNRYELGNPELSGLATDKIAPFVNSMFDPDTRDLLRLGIDFSQTWTELEYALSGEGRLRKLIGAPGITAGGLDAIHNALRNMNGFDPHQAWLTTGGELDAMLGAWLVPWMRDRDTAIETSECPKSDVKLIRYL